MTELQYDQKQLGAKILKLVKAGKLTVNPAIFTVVAATLYYMAANSEVAPTLSYGKAIKIRPRKKGKTLLQCIQLNLFGVFIWHYHITHGGTDRDLQGKLNSYIINNATSFSSCEVPKKHRMNTRVREWVGMGESLEEALYLIHKEVPVVLSPKLYAEAILNKVIEYIESL
jgi:hypothetical protein